MSTLVEREPSENVRKDFESITINSRFLTQSFEKWLIPLLNPFPFEYEDNEDDVTEEEIEQVKTSGYEIAEGKARRFKNVEEYLKTLDEESE